MGDADHALLYYVASQQQEEKARLVANPVVISTVPKSMRSTLGPEELSL